MRNNAIGERLRTLRAGKTQEEVAKAVGVSAMAISQYEAGKRVPQDKVKIKLSDYYGESVEALFYAH